MRADVAAGQSFTDEVVAASSGTFDRWLLGRIRRPLETAPLRFRLWDGYELSPPADPPIATIVIKNRRALLSWAWDPELNFGETYMFGAVEVRGDLVGHARSGVPRVRPVDAPAVVAVAAIANDVEAARENVHRHYDLGNEFYRLWLDREMLYTCAYFPTPDADARGRADREDGSASAASSALRPGERVRRGRLRLGRARAAHGAALRRHACARSTSRPSRSPTRGERARARGARRSRRVRRGRLPQRRAARCDAFVSVGMLEHVGLAELPDARPRDRSHARRRRPRPAALHRPQPARRR